jgi:hypothetical protein
MQRNGAGIHLGHSCHWDVSNDNVVVVKWPNDKRKDNSTRVICIVTVFALAY